MDIHDIASKCINRFKGVCVCVCVISTFIVHTYEKENGGYI